MKSKFRPQARKIVKPSAPQTWCVDIYESEEGWGMRTDEHLEFPSQEGALAYAEKFNKEAAQNNTDGHFFHASVTQKASAPK